MDRILLFSIVLAALDLAFVFTSPQLFLTRVVTDKCSDRGKLLEMFREPRVCGDVVVQVVDGKLIIRSGKASGTIPLTDAAMGLLKTCCQREYPPKVAYHVNIVSVSLLGILEILLILGLWWRQNVSDRAGSPGGVRPAD